jgi:hypothetical protein
MGKAVMGSGVRLSRRLGVAVAGVIFIVAGFATVEASSQAVLTSSAFGYKSPPSAYDIGQRATFSYTVTNLTGSTVMATLQFEMSRIISFEGVDVSTGYPALTETELAQNWWETVQIFDIPNQYQSGFSLPAWGSKTVTFTTETLTECGYYQMDSFATEQSVGGLFATGFIRVIGCTSSPTPSPSPTPTPTATPTPTLTPTPTPTPTPSPSSTPTPTGSVAPTATPTGSGSGSPTPTGSVSAASASPTGGVQAASTPSTGAGPGAGGSAGIALVVLGALLLTGALIARRRGVQPI